jgi:CO dehydrogenase/acetyl-CoA synthase delta subunit
MEAACFYEKLVISHQSMQWNMPEELNLLQKYKLFERFVLDKIHWPMKIGVDYSIEPHSLFVLLS